MQLTLYIYDDMSKQLLGVHEQIETNMGNRQVQEYNAIAISLLPNNRTRE